MSKRGKMRILKIFYIQSTLDIEYIHIYAILNKALYNLCILEQYEYSQLTL